MKRSLRFRLNQRLYEFAADSEMLALDWLRNVAGLKGTKEGCREGDCGACLVMMGGPGVDGQMEWYSATSCTLALSDLDGRHLVTIEGLAADGLTPVMKALLAEGGSQCGFCSPGFVLALTSYLVSGRTIDPVAMLAAIEGNLCRCTGYGSIRRAANILAAEFASLPDGLEERLAVLAARGVLPAALASLMLLPPEPAERPSAIPAVQDLGPATVIGGGTDYFVRNPDPDQTLEIFLMDKVPAARRCHAVHADGADWLELGPAVTISEFFRLEAVRQLAPGIERCADEIASPPIRNRATLAGNIVNASPIADMTAILLALGARLVLSGGRQVELCDFFIAYKKMDMLPGEAVAAIRLPLAPVMFNFEKVARRARLDIASANSALAVRQAADGTIIYARCSAGGIAATPLRLRSVEELLAGKKPDAGLFREAGSLAAAAGTPMSDVRGSASYRRHLMERFMWAHAIRLWPQLRLEEEFFS